VRIQPFPQNLAGKPGGFFACLEAGRQPTLHVALIIFDFRANSVISPAVREALVCTKVPKRLACRPLLFRIPAPGLPLWVKVHGSRAIGHMHGVELFPAGII
jgi:hypothetical protein